MGTHKVSRKTTVTAQTIDMLTLLLLHMLCTTDIREVWHFQTIGHVAGETDIKDSCLNTFILYDIHHM